MLTTNLEATKDIDLVKLFLEQTIKSADFTMENSKNEDEISEAKDIQQETAKILEGYRPKEDTPIVTIGYIPVRKLTELRHKQYELTSDNDEKLTASYLDANVESQREFVRWAVRDHKELDVPYKSETHTFNGKEYRLATDEMLDVYQGLELLQPLFATVVEYNTIDQKKRMQFLSKLGISRLSPAAKSAKPSPE